MEINDYSKYTNLLKNGFMDKLFFTDKLFGHWDSLLDYGCGDGFTTKLIAEIYPDKMVTGYDEDARMINLALNSGSLPVNVNFTDKNSKDTKRDVLYLSSFLHELYSYKNPIEIQSFWDYVFDTGFKYIIVRDMLYDTGYDNKLLYDVYSIRETILKWCKEKGFLGELNRFEEIYGSLMIPKNLIHFLLKYLYISSPNWERELRENYLMFSLQDLYSKIPSNYNIVYKDTYCLPYLKHTWQRDFGINLHIRTHGKLIVEKTI